MFSVPRRYEIGAVRSQIIHFGCSLKEDLLDDKPMWFEQWLQKLENVLSLLVWHSVIIHVERDNSQLISVKILKQDGEKLVNRNDIFLPNNERTKKY